MSAPYSNVRGIFKTSTGAVRSGITVLFEPIGAPYALDGDLVTSDIISATTTAQGKIGYYTTGDTYFPLVQGTYRVIVSDKDVFVISVPGDSGNHDIDTLVVTGFAGAVDVRKILTVAELDNVFQSTSSVLKTRRGDSSAPRHRILVVGAGGMGAAASGWDRMYRCFDANDVVALGSVNTGGLSGTIDLKVGAIFHDYIYPYSGSYGSGSDDSLNHFWYALGLEDWIPGNVTAVTNYLTLPNNERYYKKSLTADVAIFVIDSRANEPDGNTQASTQGVWLQNQLATATERVKIVCFQDSPFASKSGGYSFPAMDWPFAQWGASMVVASGQGLFFNERLTLSGNIPLYVVANRDGFYAGSYGTPLANSQYHGYQGYLVLDVNEYSVKAFFVDQTGLISDAQEYVNPITNYVKASVLLGDHTGLIYREDGLAIDIGTANGQVLSGTDWYRAAVTGKIMRAASLPLVGTVQAFPWLKECLYLIGDDPPSGIWYWNHAVGSWSILVNTSGLTSYYNNTRTKLSDPSLTPSDGASSAGVRVTHASCDSLMVSINGGFFEALPSWNGTSGYVYFGADSSPKWVAVYAVKSGYIDSDIIIGQYTFA